MAGTDLAAVAALSRWVEPQARMMVLGHADVIRRIAAALDKHGNLGAQALAALIG